MQNSGLFKRTVFVAFSTAVIMIILLRGSTTTQAQTVHLAGGANQAFNQASKDFGVPASLLKALCYMEGRLSNHGGSPSIDQGYGCMHLVQNSRVHTLDQAAKDLGVSTNLLKTDLTTNIRGGASVLHDYALQLSSNHTLPTSLADWYGAIAAYSNASTQNVAHMYADGVYKLLNSGFSASTDTGEVVTLAPQIVKANVLTASNVKTATTLPTGCVNDGKTDYPGAIDCILDPNVYDCNIVSPGTSPNPCSYEDSNRPTSYPVLFVGIHDIEGTVQDALNVFQNINNQVSIHYIVDTDGTVYQVVHDKDISYHIGNYWYNQRAIGIEHAGFDATGFQWYNAAEYLGSAKLVSYLLKKYNIPLDHDHVVSHGTVPSPAPQFAPNHVDPGPYWLWDYYFKLIHRQGVPYGKNASNRHIISLQPRTDRRPYQANGTETPANFNFFYLYNGPSTQSGLLTPAGNGSDITDETNNVEPAISYYYLAKVKDPAGTGDTLYEIWYGEDDHLNDPTPSHFENAKLVWLAVPAGTDVEGHATPVKLNFSGDTVAKVYGRPVTNDFYQIGDAPNDAVFASAFTITEDGTTNLWYEINYNHRQAWVPATEITAL
jgi:N-acetyl-anhydromuramyl-L-alanine amidase AmpD